MQLSARFGVTFLVLGIVASPGPAAAQDYADSSMLAWTDAVAEALVGRLPANTSEISLRTEGGRGVDGRKVATVFVNRLRSALRKRGVRTGAGVEVTVAVSIDGPSLWAVGSVRTATLGAFAVSHMLDRELEALLGAQAGTEGGARWTLERLGTTPAGVLDLDLVDLDDDGSDDLILLRPDSVTTLRWNAGDPRPTPLADPFPLPNRTWPRTVAGRLAVAEDSVIVSTTAGHGIRMGLDGTPRGTFDGVPVRQPPDPAWDSWITADWTLGGPSLRVRQAPPDVPENGVRDLQRMPREDDSWLWITSEGRLGGSDPTAGSWCLPNADYGDRFLVAELDGSGRPELVTTAAVPFGEPDRVVVHRLEGSPPRPTTIFRAAFDGTVRALAAGDLDFDGDTDIVLVEETDATDAVLWRLERR